ncbi:MAG: type III pantothenate kinase [Pontibacterium sp.]
MLRLEIDAGNTRVKWRLVSVTPQSPAATVIVESGNWLTSEPTYEKPTAWSGDIRAVWIASVAGEAVNQKLAELCEVALAITPVFAISQASGAGVRNGYAEPSQMGVDRWLVMLAAYANSAAASVVVDAGSAITIDFTDDAGQHLGGYILPGRRLLLESLRQNTAQVAVPDKAQPSALLGQSTQACVLGGVDLIVQGMVSELVAGIDQHLGNGIVWLTGGDAPWFAHYIDVWQSKTGRPLNYQIVPDLVLDGLAVMMPLESN